MQGERITEQSIRETTAASYAAAGDPDSRARPIVAEAVSVFGKVVLIFLKLIAGLIVFGLIMGACALIIGLFAVVIGGGEILMCDCFDDHSLWLPVLGIVVVLIPTILLIYVLMCLIASRKPGGRTVLAIFLLWLASIVALSVTAIRGNVGDRLRRSHDTTERLLNTPVVIDSDTTTLEELLHDFDEDTSIVDTDGESLHISVPSRSIDITIDKKAGRLNVTTDEVEAAIAAAQ